MRLAYSEVYKWYPRISGSMHADVIMVFNVFPLEEQEILQEMGLHWHSCSNTVCCVVCGHCMLCHAFTTTSSGIVRSCPWRKKLGPCDSKCLLVEQLLLNGGQNPVTTSSIIPAIHVLVANCHQLRHQCLFFLSHNSGIAYNITWNTTRFFLKNGLHNQQQCVAEIYIIVFNASIRT